MCVHSEDVACVAHNMACNQGIIRMAIAVVRRPVLQLYLRKSKEHVRWM